MGTHGFYIITRSCCVLIVLAAPNGMLMQGRLLRRLGKQVWGPAAFEIRDFEG